MLGKKSNLNLTQNLNIKNINSTNNNNQNKGVGENSFRTIAEKECESKDLYSNPNPEQFTSRVKKPFFEFYFSFFLMKNEWK